MSKFAEAIQLLTELVRRKVEEKIASNPRAFGKVSAELTIQDGKIQHVQIVSSESIKLEKCETRSPFLSRANPTRISADAPTSR